jgi:hypothetical protein
MLLETNGFSKLRQSSIFGGGGNGVNTTMMGSGIGGNPFNMSNNFGR